MIQPPGTLDWCRAAGLLLPSGAPERNKANHSRLPQKLIPKKRKNKNSVPKSGQCLFGHYNNEEI